MSSSRSFALLENMKNKNQSTDPAIATHNERARPEQAQQDAAKA